MTLVMEAERILGTSDSSPATDIFQTLVSTFKSNMDDFMLRAEQRYKELDTLVHVYRFCDQVGVFSPRAEFFCIEISSLRLLISD